MHTLPKHLALLVAQTDVSGSRYHLVQELPEGLQLDLESIDEERRRFRCEIKEVRGWRLAHRQEQKEAEFSEKLDLGHCRVWLVDLRSLEDLNRALAIAAQGAAAASHCAAMEFYGELDDD